MRRRYGIDADLSECRVCGALVSDEARHTQWHKQLAVLLALQNPDLVR